MNEKKSNVVCINGEVGRRRWKLEKCYIGVLEESNTYDGRKINCGFKSMGDRMEVANGLRAKL